MANVNLILSGFGLQHVKPKFFKSSDPLKGTASDFSGAGLQPLSDDDFNMATSENGNAPISMLGTPVFCDMIIENQAQTKKMQLLWVLCEVNLVKEIVKTKLQGTDNTVKEYISRGDYDVNIKGGLYSEFSNAYPKADVIQLRELLELPEALKVTSEFLQMFNIYELVVESAGFPQAEAVQNIQLFNIKCCEDKPIQLKFNV